MAYDALKVQIKEADDLAELLGSWLGRWQSIFKVGLVTPAGAVGLPGLTTSVRGVNQQLQPWSPQPTVTTLELLG